MKFSIQFSESTVKPIKNSFRVMSLNKTASFFIIALSTLSFVADGLALVSVVPIFQIIQTGELNRSSNIINSFFLGISDLLAIELTVVSLLALATIFFALKIVLKLIADLGTAVVTSAFGTKLRFRLLSAITAAEWQYFKTQSVGQFANALTIEASKSQGILRYGIELSFAVIQFFVLSAFALTLSWKLAVLFFIAAMVSALLASPFYLFLKASVLRQSESYNKISATVIDWLNGIKPAKAMNINMSAGVILGENFNSLNRANIHQAAAKSVLRHVIEFLGVITIVGSIIVNVVYINVEITLISGSILLFYRAVGVLNTAQGVVQSLINCDSFYSSLEKRLEQAETKAEKHLGVTKLESIKNIQFKKVSFAFGERTILADANVVFNQGEISLLVGPSGVGKSTIVDLVAGLLLVDSGEILVNGVNLQQINMDHWRGKIGYVAQEMFLQNDTLRNNVLMGREGVDDQAVIKALHDAGLQSEIRLGYLDLDLWVGEKGVNLSGGQRQRVALARGLAGQPKILILDEFTSSMDSETEKTILNQIKLMCDDMIVILISHQSTLIPYADKIITVCDQKLHQETPSR